MIFFLLHISTYEGYAALAFLLNRLRSAVKSNILFLVLVDHPSVARVARILDRSERRWARGNMVMAGRDPL